MFGLQNTNTIMNKGFKCCTFGSVGTSDSAAFSLEVNSLLGKGGISVILTAFGSMVESGVTLEMITELLSPFSSITELLSPFSSGLIFLVSNVGSGEDRR